ncbi:hypothetical protein JNUCC1_02543 [Lentibacillus sp. JNUCC-1]|uniref:ABC transporter permease n=1 Tax=Lentibacillus sp. JNUCC-1 TaxID=2654513 RepID=UPI0012E80987|nr:ABC transporter permease subunit [Lentibacillus sp. JNUCC-1]MUV38689.1 hypothetical protein [Lentibacillus sp. JNUCC-1]
MFQLILFEFKKVYKSLFFRLMLLLIILLIITYYIFVYMNTVRTDHLIADEKMKISQLEQTIAEQEQSEGNSVNDINSDQLTKTQKKVQALEQKDWHTLLDIEIKQMEPGMSQRMDLEYMGPSQWPSFFTEVSFLEKYRLMRDRDIAPVLPIHFVSQRTIYDVTYETSLLEKSVLEYSNKYSSVGLNFLNRMFQTSLGVIGAAFFVFLFGDMFTKEGLGRHGPIHFLRTQPLHFWRIMVGKVLVALALSAAVLFGVIVVSLLMGTVFDRFGDYDYPVLVYGDDFTFSFMNMSTLLIKSVGLFLMVLLFCYLLLMFYSIITKRAVLAIGLTLATVFIGASLSEPLGALDVVPLNPFQYFSVVDVATQELAASLQNFNISFTNGLIVLATASALLALAVYIVTQIKLRQGLILLRRGRHDHQR